LTTREWRPLLGHAGTVLTGQLAVMAFGVADTMIAGRHSPQALATLSIATAIYISVYVALNGLLQALLPVWAELHGARQHRALGRSVRQSLYLCVGASVLGVCALLWPQPWLRWTGVPSALWPQAQSYLQVLAVAVVPSLLFRLYGTLHQSLGMPRRVTALQGLGLLVKVPLSVVLTFGLSPDGGLGVVGCAWATLVVNTLMLLAGLASMRDRWVYKRCDFWRWPEAPHLPTLRRFLRLGVPAGLSVMVEVTSFTMMALLIARMGEVAMASHQIAASLAAVLYMVPLSLGIATSARTGYWLGAGEQTRATQSVRAGLLLATLGALACAVALWGLAPQLARAFTRDVQVAAAASVWLTWVALYHVADAVQAVCVFALRCWGVTVLPLLAYAAGLWGLGLWGGYLLAYQGLGPWPAQGSVASFWVTSTVALAGVALLFLGLLAHTLKAARGSGR